MPPRINSRHSFTTAQTDAATRRLYLGDRVPFRFRDVRDNTMHTVRAGDTLWGLASIYFAPLGRPPIYSAAMLYWVIQDFQPTPIHDPTIALQDGEVLVIPSVPFVLNEILRSRGSRSL